ncbi:hypothetical protein ACVCAH_00370 [Micromonospora sp. LZ34]
MSTPRIVTTFGVPTLSITSHYPDLRPLRRAVVRRDWPAVVDFFAGLPAEHDPSVATNLVANLKGAEKILEPALHGPLAPELAGTLLGARWVTMGWEARGGRAAKFTSAEQFEQFHAYLGRADELLGQVTADEPGNVSAWTTRVRIARGLSVGLAEARRRYEQAAKSRPHPFIAQLDLAQQLCPKWGGSFAQLHAFAAECAAQSPPGALNAAVVAEAHIEQARAEKSATGWMRQPWVRAELSRAVERSVEHPAYRPVHGWVQAHSTFAYAWTLAGDRRRAARHFAALRNKMTDYPWKYWLGSGRTSYKVRQLGAFVKSVGRGGEPASDDDLASTPILR